MNPVARALTFFPWEVFSTLTYESNSQARNGGVPSRGVRLRMLHQWFRKIEQSYSIPSGKLIAAVREEPGEKNGRLHYHALLGGLYYVPGRGVIPSPNPTSDQFRLEALWQNHCGKSAGFCQARAYNTQLSGVEYIMKGLQGFDWSSQGANTYELNKYDDRQEDRELILTPSLQRYLVTRSSNRRHLKARDLKIGSRDRSARGTYQGTVTPKRFTHFADPTVKN